MKAVTERMVDAKDGSDGGALRGADPIAVDAEYICREVFPSWCVRSWRTLDYGGKVPRGYTIGGKKLWKTDDLRAWAAMGFPSRAEFEERMKVNGRA